MNADDIKKELARAGHTRAQLAQLLKLDPSAITRLLQGKRQLKAAEADKIREWFALARLHPAVTLQNPQESDGQGGTVKQSAFFETAAQLLATFSIDDRIKLLRRAAEISEAHPTEEATAR